MDTSWQMPDEEKPREDEPTSTHEVAEKPLIVPKKYLLWGIFGVVFLLVYSGGTYYVLFANKEPSSKKDTITAFPTTIQASATPIPTPTAVPTLQPTEVPMELWKIYTSQTYGLTMKYPPEMVINFNKTEIGVAPYLIVFSYPNATKSGQLRIEIQDPRYIGQSETAVRSTIELGLQEYANKKRDLTMQYNDLTVSTRRTGPLEMLTLSSLPAYSFTVSGSYRDDRTYQKMEEEHTYLFSENRNYKMIISYPTNDALLVQILKTLQFF